MKNLIAFTLLAFVGFMAFAQKVKPEWNEATNEITIKGKYYASMEKKPGDLLTGKDWWISNRDGEIIIQFKTESYQEMSLSQNKKDYLGRPVQEETIKYRVKIIFPQSGSYANFNSTPLGMGAKMVMKKIARNELIVDGDLNWVKAVMFIEGNGGFVNNNTGEIALSDEPVVIKGGDIYQNDLAIGKLAKRDTGDHHEYNVYNVDGVKVMTATIEKLNPFEWILTASDGSKQTVLYDDDADGVKILTFLAKNGSFQ